MWVERGGTVVKYLLVDKTNNNWEVLIETSDVCIANNLAFC